MNAFSKTINRLIEEFRKFPGIGPKTAQRFAYHVLKKPDEEIRRLAAALIDTKEKVHMCSRCFNFTEDEICSICRDPKRNYRLLCVVEEAFVIPIIEKTNEFNGVYHVLKGALNPLKGTGPEQLKIQELKSRIEKEKIEEVIIATNPNIEGEATALYVTKILRPLGIKLTRIAHGLPIGSDLEYADQATMAQSLMGRIELKE